MDWSPAPPNKITTREVQTQNILITYDPSLVHIVK